MQYLNYYSKLTIQQILVFLAVAESESVTHAAEKCHLTHSAVSKNIGRLEETLGVYLFVRHKQRLRLTPAGRGLYRDLQKVTEDMESAFLKASCTQRVEGTPLVIGVPSGIASSGYLDPTLEYCRDRIPELDYVIEGYYYSELPLRLADKSIDINFTFGLDFKAIASSDLRCELLLRCPWIVFMREDNPLASQEYIAIEDLKTSEFLFPYSSVGNTYTDTIMALCVEHGFYPRIGWLMHTITYALHNLNRPDQVLVADPFAQYHLDNIVSRPLDSEGTGILIACRNEEVGALSNLFVDTALEYWAAHPYEYDARHE